VRPNRKQPPISDKEMKAVREYLTNGFDKGKALRKAGYSESTSTTGDFCKQFFLRPQVRAEIERRLAPAEEKAGVTVEWILERMKERADAGRTLAKFRKVVKGELTWDFTGATEADLRVIDELTVETFMDGRGLNAREVKKTKIKAANPDVSLLTLARHKGMLSEKNTGELGETLVERLQRGRLRAKPKTETEDD